MKYTDKELEKLKDCSSINEALNKLGLKSGGHKTLRERLKVILKGRSTYKGQGHNKNKSYRRKKDKEYYTNSKIIRTSHSVRLRLIKDGLKKEICECCGLDKWMGKKIPLELHHIDGNKFNNTLENLQILCPNCHYFTDNYKSKNVKIFLNNVIN